jgi:molecular chaperone DnaK
VEDNGVGFKVKCSNLDKFFTPQEISAQILRTLTASASKYLGQTVEQAVVTVPAYFNDSQRQATKDAGKIAGLDVLRIINEPTAASLAYGLDKKNNERILVFDLGGGTFDVSLLDVGDGVFEVLSTSGDTRLGGDNFDRKIVDFLLEEFESREGIKLETDGQALQRLLEAAEKAKIELSTLTETNISLPFITSTDTGPKHLESSLTREKFEKICETLFNKCVQPVEQALKDARVDASKLDEIVLVGGSTRMPKVQQLVKSLTGKTPNQSVNPDEVVAIGAAIQGAVLSGEIKDIVLLDVTPLSLGIETVGGIMTKIIPRNITIPTKKSSVFSTVEDNQTNVQIHVLQGEREFATDNKSLGQFTLEGIPLAPRNVPKIEVSFEIDVNGILVVKAMDKVKGIEQSLVIKDSSKLSDSDLTRIINEASEYANLDKERKLIVETKNEANSLVYETNQILATANANLQKLENEKELIQKITDSVKQVDQFSSSDSMDSLKEEMEFLKTNLQLLKEKVKPFMEQKINE